MRSIPFAMATQHPDNASVPYWSKEKTPFVDARSEVAEAHECFSALGCTEYMWDWEGKHVDEAVVERLFEKYGPYFTAHPLGKESFLTFRVPNPWEESGYKLARAFVNITSASEIACECNMHSPPVFEAILPMTQSGKQLHWMRSKYRELSSAISKVELRASKKKCAPPEDIEWIPLVETTQAMSSASKILSEYLRLCKESKFGEPSYLRPFIARSDPALNSGLVPAVLCAKICLSECAHFTNEHSIPTYPIIGVGSLPFRGGFNPTHESLKEFSTEYAGVRTPTIQSAFRYDYPKAKVTSAIKSLPHRLKGKARAYSRKEKETLSKLIKLFTSHYQQTIGQIAPEINRLAQFVPARRERRLHVGLFGYSRKVGKASLPRAITFTATLYSIGVPPELIGTGRGLAQARKEGLLGELSEAFSTLPALLERSGRYLNKENLAILSDSKAHWKPVLQDVAEIEAFLGEGLGPKDDSQYLHRNLTSNIRVLLSKSGRELPAEISRAAVLRKSLG